MAKRGRKSLQEESIKMQVINKSWFRLLGMLNSKVLPEETKNHVALEIAKKSCPQNINIEGDLKIRFAERLLRAREEIFGSN